MDCWAIFLPIRGYVVRDAWFVKYAIVMSGHT